MNYEITYLADEIHHAEELATLQHAEWGHLSPSFSLNDRIERLKQVSGKDEVPTVLIAVDGSTVFGSVALVVNDMQTRAHLTPWLAAVYVKPELRRNGIASALVSRAEAQAILFGVHKLYLYTESYEQFYARRGWELMEHADYRGTEVAVMQKSLASDKVNR